LWLYHKTDCKKSEKVIISRSADDENSHQHVKLKAKIIIRRLNHKN
jgi:hypothetical protein